ncbi:four-helix bundle copper-binding protein [soil metagenome]
MAHQLNTEMRECIANCTECHTICVETANHCLQMGGEHADASHIRELLDCAQACAISADFMLRGSQLHAGTCGVCADACERCAESCELIGGNDELMQRCAEICRRCAESCRRMAA